MESFYKGSDWNKWDLHIHTPISIEQHYGGNNDAVWDSFINDLELLDPHYSVLGINDYFTINGFKKLIDLQTKKGILKGRVLYPVIELRITAFGNLHKEDPWKRVNMHVIFNNNNIELIEKHFLNILPLEYHDFKKYGLDDSVIEDLGQYIINRQPEGKREGLSPKKVGFKNLNYEYKKVCDLLKNSGLDYFISIGKSEWESMRWDGSAIEKMEVVDRSHFLFTSTINLQTYNNSKTKLIDQNIFKPLLDCSDAHSFSDSIDSNQNLIKDRIGNSLTWIKADCTFEGLKQICYEPETRLSISEKKPITPVRKINCVQLSFPSNTKIAKKDGKTRGRENDFCLRGELTFSFSPYFTCLIGGRGTGKSTILNLIASKLGNNPIFFDQNILLLDSKQIEINKHIKIDTSSNEIEFISQNQIEKYAETYELTEAIYDRLIQISDFEEFKNLENEIELYCESIEKQIADINLRYNQRQEIIKLKNELNDYNKITSSYDSPEYKTLTTEIKNITEQILSIKSSRSNYYQVVRSIEEIKKNIRENTSSNQYNDALVKISSVFNSILEEENNFSITDSHLIDLETQIQEYKLALDSYLKKQGISTDDINDYERAVTQLPIINSKINNLTISGKETSKRIESFDEIYSNNQELKEKFENKLVAALNPFNDQLKSNNSNVLDIKFEYLFNEDTALNSLLDEFEVHFKEFKPSEHSTKTDSVRDYLLCVDPLKVDTYENYMVALENKGSSPKAKTYIKNLFQKKENFETYKLLIKKVYNNPLAHKKNCRILWW